MKIISIYFITSRQTLNKHNMTGLASTVEEESTASCISTEHSKSEEEENPQQIDVEEGTINHDAINHDKTQYSHICVPLPGQQCVSSTNGIDTTNETTCLNILETRNVPNLCAICHTNMKCLTRFVGHLAIIVLTSFTKSALSVGWLDWDGWSWKDKKWS